MTFSTDSLVNWMAGALLMVGLVAVLTGMVALRRLRASTFFRQRRQAQMNALRNIMLGLALLSLGLLVAVLGRPVAAALQPPTAIPTATLPTPTRIDSRPDVSTPTRTDSRPDVSTPTRTDARPGVSTPTRTDARPDVSTPTATPGPTGLPTLPIDRLIPPGTLTVTPPAEAVIANLRLSRFNNCASQRGVAETFTPNSKTLYALFDYNNWLGGVAWTTVWRYEGDTVLVETFLWDGSTGGCGFADFDNAGEPWRVGAYEVQVFIGTQWLGSAAFTIQP